MKNKYWILIVIICLIYIYFMTLKPSNVDNGYKKQLNINTLLRDSLIKEIKIRDKKIIKRDSIIHSLNKSDSIIQVNLIKKKAELKLIKGKFDKLNDDEISKELIKAFVADTTSN